VAIVADHRNVEYRVAATTRLAQSMCMNPILDHLILLLLLLMLLLLLGWTLGVGVKTASAVPTL
jgi:hypothetical protein